MKLLILTTLLVSVFSEEFDPLSNEFINYINSLNTTWKAGRNFMPDVPHSYIRRLMGVHPDAALHRLPPRKHHLQSNAQLPEQFDPREQWPNCPTLHEIRDQGACGSCWAVAATEVMTDRVCVQSDGADNFHFSAEDLLSCCEGCGSCEGGWPSSAWQYWVRNGLVSGGAYNSSQGCRPYEIPPCEHNVNGSRPSCEGESGDTPKCQMKCEADYNLPYKRDLHFGSSAYSVDGGVEQIQMELMTHGPVEATFIVLEDVLHYKSGVYQHVAGKVLGVHAVKILGWGLEGTMPYWLVANSWNSDWGDGGMIKILRGNDEVGIEDQIYAGMPKMIQYRKQ